MVSIPFCHHTAIPCKKVSLPQPFPHPSVLQKAIVGAPVANIMTFVQFLLVETCSLCDAVHSIIVASHGRPALVKWYHCFPLLAARVQRKTRSTFERQTTLSRSASGHRVQPSPANPTTSGAGIDILFAFSSHPVRDFAIPASWTQKGGASTEVLRKIFPSLLISTFLAELATAFGFGKVYDPYRNHILNNKNQTAREGQIRLRDVIKGHGRWITADTCLSKP